MHTKSFERFYWLHLEFVHQKRRCNSLQQNQGFTSFCMNWREGFRQIDFSSTKSHFSFINRILSFKWGFCCLFCFCFFQQHWHKKINSSFLCTKRAKHQVHIQLHRQQNASVQRSGDSVQEFSIALATISIFLSIPVQLTLNCRE